MMCAVRGSSRVAFVNRGGRHEPAEKMFAQKVYGFGDVRFRDFCLARRAETVKQIHERVDDARAKVRCAHHNSSVARPRNFELGEVALRETALRSSACRDD